MRWDKAKSQSYIQILPNTKNVVYEESGKFVPIVRLECRGLVPIKWHLGQDFHGKRQSIVCNLTI